MGRVAGLGRGGRQATGIALALLTLGLLLLSASRAQAQPVRAGATVVDGPARFEVITPTLIRMEYAADGRFEDRPTFNAVARNVTPPPFALRTLSSGLEIRTARLVLRYRTESGPLGPGNVSVRVGRQVVRPAFGSPPRSDALGGWYRGLDYYPGRPVRSTRSSFTRAAHPPGLVPARRLQAPRCAPTTAGYSRDPVMTAPIRTATSSATAPTTRRR